jgi:hypothetical protein
MKHNKLLTLSLLASFLILISASYSYAQPTLTYGTIDVCPQPVGSKVYVPVIIDNPATTLSAIDIVGKTVPGTADLVVTGVSFDDRMLLTDVLDQRYGLMFLGGGEFRFGAIKINYNDLAAGTGQVATLELEFVSDCLEGTTTIEEATAGGYYTAFVDDAANLILPAVTAGAVNVVNTDPYFVTCPGPQQVYWGEPLVLQTEATDPDIACGCDAIGYAVTAGPGSVSSTGLYQLVAGTGNIGCNTVEITVSDNYGGVAICVFPVDVLNHPPEITCPEDDINILWGETATGTVTATDPDNGPTTPPVFSLGTGALAFNGPGTPSIAPDGSFSWPTVDGDPAYIGTFTAYVIATDNANLDACNLLNADTCSITINCMPKFHVCIEDKSEEKGDGVLQGHYHDLDITIDAAYTSMEMGGFDFLVSYEHAQGALTFISAEMGDLLLNCEWEFFTYRYGPYGNCGDACPSGMVRMTAMAETNDGPHHPICYDNAGGFNVLAVMTFFISNDRTYECMYAPVEWFWTDCGDNTISSKYGDTLFMEDRVWHYDPFVGEITDHMVGFPSYTGIMDACLVGDKEFPLRAIDFCNGGFKIICSGDIDARGDINCNGLMNEIADAVMFTNYFIAGLAAFGDHVEASIAASDVNADGNALSVADLVYLVRIIQGDALPYPKLTHGANNIAITSQLQGENLIVRSDAEAGAALLVFEVTGNVGEPILLGDNSNMDIAYGREGNELRVLVYDIEEPNSIQAGDLLTIPVDGSIELREVEAADFDGNILNVSLTILPSRFDLAQNYPNPFNPSTSIALSLPVASDYTVKIYNIAGQLTRSYSGSAEAGVVEVVWDGKDSYGNQVASGMYFYKATASNFSATKKMILMK